MNIEQTQIERSLISAILPKADRYDVPPGCRQFRMLSLLVLLTVVALVAAAC
jgi:hypothetical protein